MGKRIGVGIIGSGFIANFHVRSWQGVRHGDIVAIAARNPVTGSQLASLCRELDVGDPKVYDDIRAMVRQSDVDAVWVTVPNHIRVETVEAIVEEVKAGRSKVKAIAMEKPLARNAREAKRILQLVEEAGLLHGYLENQVLRRRSCAAARSSGGAVRRWPARRTWPALPRSTRGLTCRGSGGGPCKAAGYSAT